jgi:hypothetical protein
MYLTAMIVCIEIDLFIFLFNHTRVQAYRDRGAGGDQNLSGVQDQRGRIYAQLAASEDHF